uniref:Uncharacterized protein n=1 Tax=Leersia perrieri TaxID=77586 RepID=A0A0D9XSE2_9ORYZ
MWNKGILECVPSAFVNAFVALVKSRADAPAMSLPSMFNFLPVHPSHVPLLEELRSGIKEKVLAEDIMPCESCTLQKMFCKPGEVGRLKPEFWTILKKAQESGVDLKNISTHGTYVLSCHFDKSIYNGVLAFLDVKNVSAEWYAECIEGSNLVDDLPEELYIELLYFVAANWESFTSTRMKSIPLLKYFDSYGYPSLGSISGANKLCISSQKKCIQWLISWNQEFPSCKQFFLPLSTETALDDFSNNTFLTSWLQRHVNVKVVSVYNYGSIVASSLDYERRAIVAFAHFLYHSFKMGHIESYLVTILCYGMPIINNYGKVVKTKKKHSCSCQGQQMGQLIRFLQENNLSTIALVNSVNSGQWMKSTLGYRSPSNCIVYDSDWGVASCISTLPFLDVQFYGDNILDYRPELELLGVLVGFKDNYTVVIDNFEFHSNAISSEATVLILKCIRYTQDIKWIKTNVGFCAPSETFLIDPEWECLLKVFSEVPLIDLGFYGVDICSYKEELKKTGLVAGYMEASKALADLFKQMVSKSSLTKEIVLSLLASYRQLKSLEPSPMKLFNCLRDEKWLHTSQGFRCPSDTILFDESWWLLSPIASLPFINDGDSGNGLGLEIYDYKDELKDLGVTVEVKDGASFVIMNLKIPNDRFNPNAEDHCKLWSTWEASVTELTMVDCSAFWGFILENWTKATEMLLSACVTKVPVCNEGKITLSNKEDIFIPDDLLLKDLFDKLPQESIFIWYPPASLPYISRARFNCIYNSIGVRKISEAVEWNESFIVRDTSFRKVDVSTVIRHDLLQIVTAFLANPVLDIPAIERHKMVSHLLNVTILETIEPITAGYSVKLSSGRHVSVDASRMLRWKRDNSKLYMQRCDQAASHRGKIEFASYFADEISQGLLFEMEDQIPQLTELVKFDYLLDFHELAVEFLLKSKNLQLFPEDKEFLDSAMWS